MAADRGWARGAGRRRGRRAGGALVLAAAAALAGCGGPSLPPAPPGEGGLDAGSPALLADHLDGRARRWVDSTLAGLDLRARVAQLVIPWMTGGFVSPSSPEFETPRHWVEDVGVGGVYVSIGSPQGTAARVNALQRLARVPLLVTSDFESGGPGMRLPPLYTVPGLFPNEGGTVLPPTMAFGAIGDEGFARGYGRVTAEEARAVGVELDFAPVLDVNSNPANPVIGTRSFGGDPELVARLGVAYIDGAREGGVEATAKHFPGHGDTRVDSHQALPVVPADRARLDRVELVPFRAAIDHGVTAVMTAHVSLPDVLGPEAPPATMAPEIVTGLLRDELGFQGLIVTDALSMGAITDRYGAGEAAVKALEAGSDVLLFPTDVDAAVDAVVEAVRSGRVTPERLERSVRRVLEAKARAGLHLGRIVDLDAVERRVGTGAHRAFADSAAARSITLVEDRDGLVPLAGGSRVLSVTLAGGTDLLAGQAFNAALRSAGLRVHAVHVDASEPDGPAYEALAAAADSADVVVAGVYLGTADGAGEEALPAPFRAWLRRSVGRRPTVLVSLGNPYLLSAAPEVGSYLLAWGGRPLMQRAAARALTGRAAITGRLPIALPPDHAIGDGLGRGVVLAATDQGFTLPPGGEQLRNPGIDAVPEATPRGEEGKEPGPAADTVLLPPLPSPPAHAASLPMAANFVEVDPAAEGMDPRVLESLDAFILAAVADSASPGAALAVGRHGKLVRLRGYGHVDWQGERPATPATLWDLASLTKVVATTTAVMILVDEGRLDLDSTVVHYLPWWSGGHPRKERVTVRQLLTHRSGLPAFERWFMEIRGVDAYKRAVAAEPLESDPGSAYTYSDLGFMTLGWIVEAVAGEPLDRFVDEKVFQPLGMDDTGYLPDPALLPRIAPTEVDTVWRHEHVRGVVHDENADAMGGVSGHAGLFSTAWDLSIFAQMMLGGGAVGPCVPSVGSGIPCTRPRPDSVRIVQPGTVARFTALQDSASGRALGWEHPSGRSSAGDYFTAAAFGHTGFTGTSIWIDPELDLFVVLLTARVNPTRANMRHLALRRGVHDLAARAITDRPVTRRPGSR